jgi:hypothetical protein
MDEMTRAPDKNERKYKNLNEAWQLTGAFTAPVLFTFLVIQYVTNPALNLYQWLLWLHLPLIMIHEFEEYIFPGGFKHFINTRTFLANEESMEDSPLNEAYEFLVNPVLIWPWAIIGAVFYTIPWIGFALIIFQVAINNMGHTILFQIRNKGYNPGLFTTIILLLPYCTLVTWYVIAYHVMTTTDWILSFVLGLGIFGLLLSTTLKKMKAAQDPH